MGGSSAGGNGGGSPNQMVKDKAKKDAKKTASVEMGLGKDKMSNYSVTEGGTGPERGGDGENNKIIPKVKIPKVDTAPTTAEVDQSSATDATTVKEDDIYTRKKKSKARGRSMMTLTSAQGVKKDDNLVLGKRSLLGS